MKKKLKKLVASDADEALDEWLGPAPDELQFMKIIVERILARRLPSLSDAIDAFDHVLSAFSDGGQYDSVIELTEWAPPFPDFEAGRHWLLVREMLSAGFPGNDEIG